MKSSHTLATRITVIGVLAVLFAGSVSAQHMGGVNGQIRDAESKQTLELVNVVLKGTSTGVASDKDGKYRLKDLPAGEYLLVFSAIGYKTLEIPVSVRENDFVLRNVMLTPDVLEMGEVMVYGASLRRERFTDAPAALSLVEGREIARKAGSGQLAKLLETEPGVDMVQNGLYDFNVNTRGFNSSLNRRLLVLLDGRDLGTAFLGATEWNGLSTPLEELGRLELVRGPGSALYGANAYNGVLNITSIPPRASIGTRIILGGGELSTYRGDIRHAGVTGQWSYRVNAGGYSGNGFSVPRMNNQFEYDGFNAALNNEVVALNTDPIQSFYGSARVDYEYESGGISSLEGGYTEVQNEVIVTGIGRVQVQGAKRPWGRLAYSGHGFNAVVWTSGRFNKKPDLSLSTGLNLVQDALITQGEVQYSFKAVENLLFVVLGGSHRLVNIDTDGTLMLEKRNDNMSGLFGQIEYKFARNISLLGAARWDRSTLHESQFSPKVAVVYTPRSGHTFRATFNQAFQAPNYSELFLHVKHPTRSLAYYGNLVTNPPGLSSFKGGLTPGPPQDLTVERITSYEIGYKGILDNSLFVTVDGYYSLLRDFITDLAPRVNPKYPGDGLYPSDTVLSRTIWSYANAGAVNQWGIEFGAEYYATKSIKLDLNATYFEWDFPSDVTIDEEVKKALIPNSPKWRIAAGMTYSHSEDFEVSVSFKHVPDFDWSAGVFSGKILSYTLVNLAGTYHLTKNISFNVNIANLLDDKHYELFGGSLLGRRALGSVSYTF